MRGASAANQRAKDFNGSLKRLLTYLKKYKKEFLLVLFSAVLSSVLSILGPKIMGNITTELFRGSVAKIKGIPGASIDFGYILNIVMILIGIYTISAIFGYLQQYLVAGISQKAVVDLRRDVDEKISCVPLKFFDTHTHGDLLSRFTNDIETIGSTLQQSINQCITSVVTIIGVIAIMLSISVKLTVISIVILPLSGFFMKIVVSHSQQYFARQQGIMGKLNGHIEEMYTAHNVIKAFNREENSIKDFNVLNDELYLVGWKAQFLSGLIMPIVSFIGNLGFVLVSTIGGIMATRGTIQIGDVQAFIQYSRQFSQPLAQIANISNIIQGTVASAERVFELLDEPNEVKESENPIVPKNAKGEVVFEHVKFGYDENKILIKDMNIHVKPGQTVAIVGPTGAGKTTLVNLLLRFYELNDGAIKLDGVNITDMKRWDLREAFGMVLQDTWLFNGSIKDNIAYGRKNATDEEIIEAAKMAQADHFIRTLPKGYDTILNEETSNISQGQKQLLTIARAVLSNPEVLLLDEATSSVDTRTEILIQKAMDNVMSGRTSFVIAHRLSTIKDANVILVMKDGDVIEQGNHQELLKAKGAYYQLYNSQFADTQAN